MSLPRHTIGTILVLLVVILWTASSQLIQFVFKGAHFDKPFFLTYFSTANFSLSLIGFTIFESWKNMPFSHKDELDANSSPISTRSFSSILHNIRTTSVPTDPLSYSHEKVVFALSWPNYAMTAAYASDRHYLYSECGLDTLEERLPLQVRNVSFNTTESTIPSLISYSIIQVAKTAAYFVPLWCGANLCFNFSLSRTSVSSSSILSNTSSVFVCILGPCLGKQTLNSYKLLAICFTLAGVLTVSYSDDIHNFGRVSTDTTWGDLLALFGAFFYAIYAIFLHHKVPDESGFPMTMFFGFVGVIVLLTMWPLFFVLDITGIEIWQTPQPITWAYLFINCWFGTNLSAWLWAKSVVLSSPLMATIGLSLSIPLAMVSDAIIHHIIPTPSYSLGSLLVVIGFILANAGDYYSTHK